MNVKLIMYLIGFLLILSFFVQKNTNIGVLIISIWLVGIIGVVIIMVGTLIDFTWD